MYVCMYVTWQWRHCLEMNLSPKNTANCRQQNGWTFLAIRSAGSNTITAIIGRLQSAHLLPIPWTRTSNYRSFTHYGLTHYQPKLKWIISLSNYSYSFGNQNCVLHTVIIAVAVTAFFSHRIHWLFQSTDLLLYIALLYLYLYVAFCILYFVFVWVLTDCMFHV